MQATLSPRKTHAQNLALIAELSGESYYRRMTFTEAETWLTTYEYYIDEGYPRQHAEMYAWDEYHAVRKGPAPQFRRGIWA